MILAAGLGARLRPLSTLRAKPAMPVLGRPVLGYLLALLHHHGVREVVINLHHLPETIREAVERSRPPGMLVQYSPEETPLGTGGAIRRARALLGDDEPLLVLAGDMLLDLDLGALLQRHLAARSECTLVLRRDPRQDQFGTIGLDATGRVRRFATRFDLGGETEAGVFLGIRVFSPEALRYIPDLECFEDLSDWLGPELARGSSAIRGLLLDEQDCVWEPVGTPAEYLRVNLKPPRLSYLPPTRMAVTGTTVTGPDADVVVGAGAHVDPGARLARCVVWENETVPADSRGEGGVFAGGRFYDCRESTRGASE